MAGVLIAITRAKAAVSSISRDGRAAHCSGTLDVTSGRRRVSKRAADRRQALLAQRHGSSANAVPVAIAGSIDAWQEALDKFTEDALKPDAENLLDRLRQLRAITMAARDVIRERRR